MTLLSSLSEPTAAQPSDDAIPADPMGARLQARIEAIEAIEAQPPGAVLLLEEQHQGTLVPGRVPAPPRSASWADSTSADSADLNQQLDVLRGQLEAAFDEMEQRIAAAERSAASARALADAADARAQVASARAANVLHAVDDLAGELTRIARSAEPDAGRLLSAVDRLRTRLHPAPPASPSTPASPVTPAATAAGPATGTPSPTSASPSPSIGTPSSPSAVTPSG